MTLSPALAALLDRCTDPRRQLLTEAQDLAGHLDAEVSMTHHAMNGDKDPDDEDYVEWAAVAAALADRLTDVLHEMSGVYDQTTDATP